MALRWLTVLLLGAGFLNAQKVATDFNESVDFSAFKTYSWRKAKAAENAIADNRIHTSIAAQLSKKGFTEAESGGDVLVTYRVTNKDKKETERIPNMNRRGGYSGSSRVSRVYTQGTLLIDILDGKSKELIWRATCKDSVNDVAKFEKRLGEDVEKAFKKFPPKKK
jgi:Domain of unknown function (DUF4136)